jgi:putative endonuclease
VKKHDRQELGASGEQIALKYLCARGLRLIKRNYRCKGGELDLIMFDGDILALIEVRLRSDDGYGGAAASVTPAKQRRLILAAKHLLLTHIELARCRARFDVVAIGNNARGTYEVEWLKGAFTL